MSSFLLIIDAYFAGIPPLRPPLGAGYETIVVPFGHLFLKGPSATLVFSDETAAIAHHGEWLPASEVARVRALGSTPTSSWKDNRGTVIRVDGRARQADIATDVVGSFPVYYGVNQRKNRFVAGSHFSEVQAQLGGALDPLGCYEFLTTGYCVGSRTLAKGIRQLTLQETLSVRCNGDSVHLQTDTHPLLWSGAESTDFGATLDAITDLWLSETALLDRTQVMMSAGWDSRALLAGIAANNLQSSILAYSHGDLEGRELRLAGRISRTAGAAHVKAPIGEQLFGPEVAHQVARRD